MKGTNVSFRAIVTAVLMAGGISSAVTAPIVQNNSFEATTGLNPGQNYSVPGDLASVPDWTFVSDPDTVMYVGLVTAGTTPGYTGGLQALSPFPDGTQAAFIYGSSATFSQSVSGFEAGDYTVSFYASGRSAGSGPLTFQVSVGATVLTFNSTSSITPADDPWTLYTSDVFTTTAGTHLLAFTSTNGGDRASFIDLVNVNVVPEPATMALFGIAGLFLVLRRGARKSWSLFGRSQII